MKFQQHIEISRIIALSYLRELEDDEQSRLDSWLQSDPTHPLLYKKIGTTSDFTKREENIKMLDQEKIWEGIYNQISSSHKKPIVHHLYKRLLKYAAILLIPLFIAFIAWFIANDVIDSQNRIQIKPGERIAQLKLDNGTIIELGKRDTIFQYRKNLMEIKIDSGKVYYENKLQDEAETPVYHSIRVPRGGEYDLTLSDGTRVWINSETELKYFAVPNVKERKVYLKGEAYFEVKEDKDHPFIVHANGMNVRVLGTKFNVSAYPDENILHTTLVEGSVFVNESISDSHQSCTLKPSQQASLNLGDTISITVNDVDVSLYTSWVERKFHFKQIPLEDIMKKFSRWYNVEVFYDNEEIKGQIFSGIIPRFENGESFLELMERTNSVSFDYNENAIVVHSVNKKRNMR